ncbi:hypothetical protein PoB_004069200 [Plakobranchus ocellatus]|uniref:Uncharacterized protein n=1 Tax=Plakobranchus ocellatus TaxID=259542 RepID=A0AAV4B4Q7_9GAST|nr:hypothetical protein PoB_004069200 [Plakobranchus ocellatus]
MAAHDNPSDNEHPVILKDLELGSAVDIGTSKSKRRKSQWYWAKNCTNKRYGCPGLSFFRFPRDEERLVPIVTKEILTNMSSTQPSYSYFSRAVGRDVAGLCGQRLKRKCSYPFLRLFLPVPCFLTSPFLKVSISYYGLCGALSRSCSCGFGFCGTLTRSCSCGFSSLEPSIEAVVVALDSVGRRSSLEVAVVASDSVEPSIEIVVVALDSVGRRPSLEVAVVASDSVEPSLQVAVVASDCVGRSLEVAVVLSDSVRPSLGIPFVASDSMGPSLKVAVVVSGSVGLSVAKV